MEELLDIFDDNMKLLGSATRSEVHSRGLWHQTFHCWIIRKDKGKEYVLFQRRGPNKKLFPNTLDITAAGHIITGETPEEGIRELNEELGLNVKIEQLVYLGIRCDVAIIGDVINREFCHTYLYESNMSIDEYKLQLDEVSGLVQVEINDGLKLFGGELKNIQATGFQIDKENLKLPVDIQVGINDIIPRLDRYYSKIFIMANRYFSQEKYFGI